MCEQHVRGQTGLAGDDDGHTDLAPLRIGNTEHGHLGHAGVSQQDFFDLARVHVGPARDVHVGLSAGDVEQPARVHATEVTGVEPATAESLRCGLRVVEVTREDGRAAAADLPDGSSGNRLQVLVEDGDLHGGARAPARADVGVRILVVDGMHRRRQHSDAARHLAETEILHEDLAQLLQRALLVGAVHRCAGIDHVAQTAVVEAIDRRILDQYLDDGRHGENVAHPVLLDERPEDLGLQLVRGQQHGRRAAGDVEQRMNPRAVRQRRHRDRTVVLVGAGDEVGKVVRDHERHLAVGQHRRLGPPGRARGVEVPQRRVGADLGDGRRRAEILLQEFVETDLAVARLADRDDMAQLRGRGLHRVYMPGKAVLRQHHCGFAGTPKVGQFRRCQSEVGRHPDGAESERGPATLEQGHVVARLDQHLVAGLHAQRSQALDKRIDAGVDLAPGPDPLALNQPGPVREQRCRLREQCRQVGCLRLAHAASSTLR